MVQNRIMCLVFFFGLIRMCLASYGMVCVGGCFGLVWGGMVWLDLVLWYSFALVLFGFRDAWFGLVLWMFDVVCETREIRVMWIGWDSCSIVVRVAFILFQVVWFGLISCDAVCLVWLVSFEFCDAWICLIQVSACVMCVSMCVMSDKWCWSGVGWSPLV